MGELDMTVVLVTHDLAEAITLCDEIVILSNRPGRVAERHTVDIERGVDALEIRQHADFLKFYGKLWHDLSAHIRAGEDSNEAGSLP
jgi:NitT/TauT family transport system ATP-binding protein